jgi:apolipoprotein N-acyltransferase
MLLLPLSVWLLGQLRLAAAPEQGTADQVSLRIVQPAIEQKLKWERSLKLQHVLRQIEMSRAGPSGPPDVVIWAETAVPYLLEQDTALQSLLATALAEGAVLVTGAPRAGQSLGSPGLRNSLHALDHTGSITATYDKGHLVPFGEYTPLKGWLGLDKLAVGAGDFVPGIGPVTIDLEGLPPFSPLICYEVIFPGQVVAATAAGERRPEWLLNVTNDGWFGQSSGSYQHFANARLRAVEEGLPLVRAANSGISGVIDGYGRIVARLGLGEAGVLDAKLPRPVEGITLYAIIGNWVLVFELLFLTTVAFIVARRGR